MTLCGHPHKIAELAAIVASLEKEVARHSRDGGLIYQTTNCLTAHLIRLASSTPSPQGEGEFSCRLTVKLAPLCKGSCRGATEGLN